MLSWVHLEPPAFQVLLVPTSTDYYYYYYYYYYYNCYYYYYHTTTTITTTTIISTTTTITTHNNDNNQGLDLYSAFLTQYFTVMMGRVAPCWVMHGSHFAPECSPHIRRSREGEDDYFRQLNCGMISWQVWPTSIKETYNYLVSVGVQQAIEQTIFSWIIYSTLLSQLLYLYVLSPDFHIINDRCG